MPWQWNDNFITGNKGCFNEDRALLQIDCATIEEDRLSKIVPCILLLCVTRAAHRRQQKLRKSLQVHRGKQMKQVEKFAESTVDWTQSKRRRDEMVRMHSIADKPGEDDNKTRVHSSSSFSSSPFSLSCYFLL